MSSKPRDHDCHVCFLMDIWNGKNLSIVCIAIPPQRFSPDYQEMQQLLSSWDVIFILCPVRFYTSTNLTLSRFWALFKMFATLSSFIRLYWYELPNVKDWIQVKDFSTFLIKFLISMKSLMSSKFRILGKGFATFSTFIRFLPSINPLMYSKI